MKTSSAPAAKAQASNRSQARPAVPGKTVVPAATPGKAARSRPSSSDSVLSLIERVKQGRVRGDLLSNEDRLRCVEFLTNQGYSVPEISQVFGVAERTIYRDRQAVRKANALHRDPALAAELIGELYQFAEQSALRLRRLARDAATPPSSKVEAEKAAWTVIRERSELLQRVGHLPSAAQEVNARLTHTMAPEQSFEELATELSRVQSAVADDPLQAADLKGQFSSLHERISRGVLSETLRAFIKPAKKGRS